MAGIVEIVGLRILDQHGEAGVALPAQHDMRACGQAAAAARRNLSIPTSLFNLEFTL
jgi:hypothetical protein